MRSSLGGSRRRRRHLPADQWEGYLRNLGVYNGHRAVCDGKGTILADFRTEVVTERFRSGENENDEFLLWRTAVRTADGLEKSDEEWSRGELAEFGALAADGSYTLGPTVYIGEQFVVEQCLSEDSFRIRSIHAFDWEGRLCGLTACREKRIERRGEAASDVSSLVPSLTSSSQGSQIEPAAWRSPSVLLDYMLGTWTGRGIIVDKATGITRLVRSEHRWKQTDELMVRQISSLVVEGSSQRARVEAKARQDGNVLIFAEHRTQVVLLPGGISVACPFRLEQGRPFVIETVFLIRPDYRKRVVRSYNGDCEWLNSVFLAEKRTG